MQFSKPKALIGILITSLIHSLILAAGENAGNTVVGFQGDDGGYGGLNDGFNNNRNFGENI